MAVGTLLLREPTSSPLTTLVQQALTRKPPFLFYDLRCESDQLKLNFLPKRNDPVGYDNRREIIKTHVVAPTTVERNVPMKKPIPVAYNNNKSPAINVDEGFESDIDSVSLLSSEDGNPAAGGPNVRSHETDSANGSAGSDSDDTDVPPVPEVTDSSEKEPKYVEVFNLVDCMCYTDVSVVDLLIFVIKQEVLVFKFESTNCLESFYKSFSALKAICNQKAYGKSLGGATKFNLLQRTDENGMTHIQVTREVNVAHTDEEKTTDTTSSSRKTFGGLHKRSVSSENILEQNDIIREIRIAPNRGGINTGRSILGKVWNSAEDLLDSPQRPERRKKQKPKAPEPPPASLKDDVYKGQYVRVSVATNNGGTMLKNPLVLAKTKIDSPKSTKALPLIKEKHPSAYFSKSTTISTRQYQQFRYANFFAVPEGSQNKSNWTNSVPRFFKKSRSRSETRNLTPMAYRYVDTTRSCPEREHDVNTNQNTDLSKSVANRLFGMSSKLKDFSSVPYNINTLDRNIDYSRDLGDSKSFLYRSTPDFYTRCSDETERSTRSTLADLTLRLGQGAGSLKSVIKKNDKKKKNSEKKVTFSAYTTVQVV